MIMPSLASAEKRLVFEHATGLTALCGLWEGPPPVVLPPFQVLGETIPFASLYKVTERAAYYRAPVVPKSYGSMHPAQK